MIPSTLPDRILVVPLRFIGDGILTVPFLRNLRQLAPESRIDLLLPASMENLFECCPYIDHIVPLGNTKQALHDNYYSLAFLFRQSVSDAFRLKQAGIKTIVGYDLQRFPPPLNYRRWGWFLDKAVSFPPLDTDIPQVKTYLNLLEPFNIGQDTFDESLELWANENDQLHINGLIEEYQLDLKRPIAVFHITSASREKAMGLEKFTLSLQELTERGFQVIALGGQADYSVYEALATRAQVPLYNWCGLTTLRQSFALMQRVHLLFSLDSAPIHLAAAAGVPHIIGIYGPTNEKQWRPYPYSGQFTAVFNQALTCRPCAPKVCSHNQCRENLTASHLHQALKTHFSWSTQTR